MCCSTPYIVHMATNTNTIQLPAAKTIGSMTVTYKNEVSSAVEARTLRAARSIAAAGFDDVCVEFKSYVVGDGESSQFGFVTCTSWGTEEWVVGFRCGKGGKGTRFDGATHRGVFGTVKADSISEAESMFRVGSKVFKAAWEAIDFR